MDNLFIQVLEFVNYFLNYDHLILLSKVCKQTEQFVSEQLESNFVWLKKINQTVKYIKLPDYEVNNQPFGTSSLLRFRLNEQLHLKIIQLITYTPLCLVDLQLDNLQFLIITSNSLIESNETFVQLNFKNLVSLYIHLHQKFMIKIDAPKLQDFSTSNFSVRLLHPKSVKTLNCPELHGSILDSYLNLKKLTIRSLGSQIRINLFKRFTKLKEVHVIQVTRSELNQLIQLKRRAKSKTKIYFNFLDVEMNNFNSNFDKIKDRFLNETSYSVYQSNEQHVKGDMMLFGFSIENNLNVPTDFFKKLIYIEYLNVNTHKISFNNWTKLLKSLKVSHILINIKLDQKYLNLLPKYCMNLRRIHLNDFYDLHSPSSFIYKLKYLEIVNLTEFPTLALFKQLVDSLEHLQAIQISIQNEFEINLVNNLVTLIYNYNTVFREDKKTFLNYTIYSIDSFLQLFNSICDVDDDV